MANGNWAESGEAALWLEKGHCRPSAGQNAELLCIRAKTHVEFLTSGSGHMSNCDVQRAVLPMGRNLINLCEVLIS